MARLNVDTDTATSKCMDLNRRIEDLEKQIVVQACIDEKTGKLIV